MLKNIVLSGSFECFYLESKCLFFFRTPLGIVVAKLPRYFFVKKHFLEYHFCFNTISYYRRFMSHFTCSYYRKFFFLRLKVRGLGFRIKEISNDLCRFFLGGTNFLFFHVPQGVLIRVKRRRMLIVSYDYSLLLNVFAHLLLLKKTIPYKLRGVFYPKQIILLKPGKKSF